MVFGVDAYNRPERPIVYLATQNKKILGTIQARELQGDLCFNNISTVSFTVYKYEDGKPTYNYENIEETLLVQITNVGWFLINKISKNGNGVNEYKEVSAFSLEYEACSKLLTSFGQLGVSTDEQGGLDRYKLYDLYDISHSIIHIWLQKMPSWTVGYIDPAITTQYRTFTDDEVGAYSFLVEKASQSYECIFQFDTKAQTVNAYKLENIGKNTNIYLSYDNVIVNTILESDEADIKTVYTVAGGDDNGSTLGIIEVNPTGTNQIANFSYYKKWMSEALRTRYEQYEVSYNNRLSSFTNAITALQGLYGELNNLYNKLPSTPDSTNWSEYGSVALQEKYDIYNNNMALYIGKTDSTSIANYNSNYSLRESVNAELNIRKSQITAKETEIKNQESYCKSLTINLREYLGEDLFKELSKFYREDTFTDDTFIVTESMTDAEALEMKRELLDMAQKDLAKRCKPSYTLEVNALNFTRIPEFKRYTDQLELGNIMTIDFDNDILVESRLLKIHINWDNPDDFSLTFSSKNRLDGYDIQLAEVQAQSSAISTSYNINGTGWNNAKNKTSSFNEYMSSTLNLANQKLKNASNETFIADSTGTKWRKWLDETNNYSPNQMWGVGNGLYLTQNAWQTVSMAIGEGVYNGQTVYGVWAPLLCGDLILGNQLAILNEAGNFSITNANGFNAVNGIYSVGINPNTPSEIFKIAVNGTKKLYVDTVNNKLKFSGDLEAATGTFSGLITGGSININNGRFSVDQYGLVTINSNGLVVNSSNFSMSQDGTLSCHNLTATNGNFSGTIYASTINGSTINGSEFNNIDSANNNAATIKNGRFTGTSFASYEFSNVTGGAVGSKFSLINAANVWIADNSFGGTGDTTINGGNINCRIINVSNSISMNGYPLSYYFATTGHTHYDLTDGGQSVRWNGNKLFPWSTADLGDPTHRWGTIYGTLATSSDRNLKHDIEDLPEIYKQLILKLKPVRFKYNDGTSDRYHTGFISQDVEMIMQELGMDTKDFGGFIKYPTYAVMSEDGTFDTTSELTGYIYMLRYEEFISPAISLIQELEKRIRSIELKQ